MTGQTVKQNRRMALPTRQTPIRITSATIAANTATVTFDQPVVITGVPQYTTAEDGAAPTGATLTSPTTLQVTWASVVGEPVSMYIPFEDPAIRNRVGGFVADSVVPLAA